MRLNKRWTRPDTEPPGLAPGCQQMMMIAFITIDSGLVPLIEGLCPQIYYLRFEINGGLRSHLLLFFFGRKNMLKNKVVSQSKISSRLLAYTYTCVLCTHIQMCSCQDSVHPGSSGPPGVLSQLLGSHLSTPSVQCVFVCVYTHIYSHILPPTLKIEKTQTTPLFFFLSKINPPRQASSTLIDWLNHLILVPPTLNEQTAHT